MLPAEIATDTVARVRPVKIVERGRERADWDAARTVPDLTIPDCSVQPGPSTEELQNRTGVTIRWTVFASGVDLDVHERDGIEYRGEVYQVDGKPQEWRVPPLEHTVIALIDREG